MIIVLSFDQIFDCRLTAFLMCDVFIEKLLNFVEKSCIDDLIFVVDDIIVLNER